MRRLQRWDEMSAVKKVLIMVLTGVQLSLAVSAWTDLAKRSAEQVAGSKWKWAAVIAVNFLGPVLYFTRGRRNDVRPQRAGRQVDGGQRHRCR